MEQQQTGQRKETQGKKGKRYKEKGEGSGMNNNILK